MYLPDLIVHQLCHKVLSINIILKSIKGHNFVEKFGKIMCISHNIDHIYKCIKRNIKNPFIISKDIEKNGNFNVHEGP